MFSKPAHIGSRHRPEIYLRRCGLGLGKCNADKACPVHDKFVVVRAGLKQMVQNSSLFKVAKGVEVGLTYLKRLKLVYS